MKSLDKKLRAAVAHFWKTREAQATRQGAVAGSRDRGHRSAVTAGKQMDGFILAIRDALIESGVDHVSVYCTEKRYEILLTRLIRERLYDSACFLLSDAVSGRRGRAKEPSAELTFQKFVASLTGHALALTKLSK